MQVSWREHALDQLADLYVAAQPDDRDAIEKCVEHINAELAVDPWSLGESRATFFRRVWFHPPLYLMFDIASGDGLVTVHHVGPSRSGLRPGG